MTAAFEMTLETLRLNRPYYISSEVGNLSLFNRREAPSQPSHKIMSFPLGSVKHNRVKTAIVFFRIKPAGSYRYVQIVHSVRKGQKVRQQVIAILGRLDLLVASGQLERSWVSVCGTVRGLLSLTPMRPAKSNR